MEIAGIMSGPEAAADIVILCGVALVAAAWLWVRAGRKALVCAVAEINRSTLYHGTVQSILDAGAARAERQRSANVLAAQAEEESRTGETCTAG